MSLVIKMMITQNEQDVQKFIADFREEFKSLPPEEISFPRGVNGIKEYQDSVTLYKKGTPIHVKGAIIYNHLLKEKGLTKKYSNKCYLIDYAQPCRIRNCVNCHNAN
jgi:hypothetical protein